MPISKEEWDKLVQKGRQEISQRTQESTSSSTPKQNVVDKLRAAHYISENAPSSNSKQNQKSIERLFMGMTDENTSQKEYQSALDIANQYEETLNKKNSDDFAKKLAEYEERFSLYGDKDYATASDFISDEDEYKKALEKNKKKADAYEREFGVEGRAEYEAGLNKQTTDVYGRRKANKEYAYAYSGQNREDMQKEMENLQKQYDEETDEYKKFAIQQQMGRAKDYDESLMKPEDVQTLIDEQQAIVNAYEAKYMAYDDQSEHVDASPEEQKAYKEAKEALSHYKDLLNTAYINDYEDEVYSLEEDDMMAYAAIYQYEKLMDADKFEDVAENDPFRVQMKNSYELAKTYLQSKYTDKQIEDMHEKFKYVSDKGSTEKISNDIIEDLSDMTGAKWIGYIAALGAGTVADALNSPVKTLDALIQSLTGKPINVYDSAYSIANVNNAIQQGIVSQSKNQKAASMALGIYCSLAQMGATMLTGVTTGVKDISLFLMGNSAASQTILDMAQKGKSNDKIIASAIATGVAEALFENWSIEGWLHPEKLLASARAQMSVAETVKALLVQMTCEVSEEICTDVANEITDYIINGGNSNTSMSIEAYKNMGYSEAQARILYSIDFGEQLAETAFSSMIISTVMGGVSTVSVDTQLDRAKYVVQESTGVPPEVAAERIKEYVLSGESAEATDNIIETAMKKAIDELAPIATKKLDDFKKSGEVQNTTYTYNGEEKVRTTHGWSDEDVDKVGRFLIKRGVDAYFAQFNAKGQFVDENGNLLLDEYGKPLFKGDTADVNALYLTDENGNRKIYINPRFNAESTLPFLMGHEVVHDMAGTSAFDKLKQMVLDFLKQPIKNKDGSTTTLYDKYMANARKTYEGVYGDKADAEARYEEEVLADWIGDFISKHRSENGFGYDFMDVVNKHTRAWQNGLPKLMENIRYYLYSRGSDTNKIFTQYIRAFDEKYAGKDTGTKYSIIGENANLTEEQSENLLAAKYILENNIPYKAEGIWRMTGWVQDSVGNWWHEIRDDAPEVKYHGLSSAESKLEDILQHEELYEAYPQLRNISVKKADLLGVIFGGKVGGVTAETKDGDVIYLNTLNRSLKEQQASLLHEITHVIQHIEGTESGTSKYYIAEQLRDNKRAELGYNTLLESIVNRRIIDKAILQDYNYLGFKSIKELSEYLYRYSLGELQASEVSERFTTGNTEPLFSSPKYRNAYTNEDLGFTKRNNGNNSFRNIDNDSWSYERIGDTLHGRNERIAQNNRSEFGIISDEELNNAFIEDIVQSMSNDKMTADEVLKALNGRQMSLGDFFSEIVEEANSRETDKLLRAITGTTDYTLEDRNTIGLKDSTIEHFVSGSMYGLGANSQSDYSKGYLVWLSPEDFIKLTTDSQEQYDRLKAESTPLDIDNISRVANEGGGMYLRINQDTGEVTGHEGRHRMIALREAGIERVPVILLDESEKGKYNKAVKDSITLLGQQDGYLNSDYKVTTGQIVPINGKHLDLLKSEFGQSSSGMRFSVGESTISELKENQLQTILENNPANDDYHTWIRTVDDIQTFQEAFDEWEAEGYSQFTEDFTNEDMQKALSEGKITVYSSYPIKDGIFVSPSRLEAWGYSGTGKVYSKTVPLEDVAWIDVGQGQYAPVDNNNPIPITERYSNKSDVRFSEGESIVKSDEELDRRYFEALNNGDKEVADSLLLEQAVKNGAVVFPQSETPTYKIRNTAPPQKTKTVYKTFFVNAEGNPSALFVESIYDLPIGIWLDAQDAYHFTAENGLEYVPSRSNPNNMDYENGKKEDRKTGSSVKIPNDEVRQELIRRGFLPEGSKAKSVTALAYRPGWHAGDLPFFPQGGAQDSVYAADESAYASLVKQIQQEENVSENKAKRIRKERYGTFEEWRDLKRAEEHPYKNVHRFNQVVFECEIAYDTDYTRSEVVKSGDNKGKLQYFDMQEMPVNGGYKYATNPMTNAQELGSWYISGSLKINRALTQEECDSILKENGFAPQAWENGSLDLDALNYDPTKTDEYKKLLDTVTYDDNGEIIPPSQRFNSNIADPRYSQRNKVASADVGIESLQRAYRQFGVSPEYEGIQQTPETPQTSTQPTQQIKKDNRIASTVLPKIGDVNILKKEDFVQNALIQNDTNPKGTLRDRMRNIAERAKKDATYFKTHVLDAGSVLHDVSNKYNTNTYMTYINAKGSSSIADNIIGYYTETKDGVKFHGGMTDATGKVIGKSFAELQYPFQHASEEFLNEHNVEGKKLKDKQLKHWNECQEYLVMKLNLDEIRRIKRPRITGYDSGKSSEIIRNFEAKYGKAYANELSKMNKTITDYIKSFRLQTGVITEQDDEAWSQVHPNYVPTYRYIGTDAYDMPIDASLFGDQRKRAKGGDKKLLPLDEAYAKQLKNAVRFGNRNIMLNNILADAEAYNELGQHLNVLDYFDNVSDKTLMRILDLAAGDASKQIIAKATAKTVKDIVEDTTGMTLEELVASHTGQTARQIIAETTGKPNIYVVFDKDGGATVVQVDNILNTAIKDVTNPMMEIEEHLRGWQKVNEWWRGLVTTNNPLFTVSNAFRDLGQALLMSDSPTTYIKNYAKAWKEMASNSALFKQFEASGVMSSTITADTKEGQSTNWLKQAGEWVEMMPRFSAYITAIEKYGNTYEGRLKAQYEAKDITTNFSQGGDWTKVLNRNGFNFLNANVQGLLQIGRKITDPLKNNSLSRNQKLQAIGGFFIKGLAFGLTPYLLNALVYKDDKDYEELSDSIKTQYVLFKLQNGTFLRIPYGRALVISTTLANIAKNSIEGESVDVGESLKTIWDNVGVAKPSGLWTPVVDAHNNKTWYGGTLVNNTLAQREKKDQYDESTDDFSKFLGRVFNVSPKKVNYVLDQWSGFIGDFAMPIVTDKYKSDNPLDYLAAPFKSRFTTDPTTNNDLYDTYNDMFTEVKKKAATDGSYYGAEQYFYSQSKEINSIWTQIHEVQRYKSLSQEEKDALQQKYMSYGSLDTYKVRQQIIRDMRKAINGIQRNTIENYDYIIDASSKYPITDDMTFSQKKTQTFKMNNDLFGSEYALQTYGGDTWDNAQLANTCGIDFESYAEYFANTVDLRADKDENGNTKSGTLKKKKWEALSSMNLSEGQRAFLFAMEYKISQKTNYYDSKALQKALNDYINTLPLSDEEKKYLKDNLK